MQHCDFIYYVVFKAKRAHRMFHLLMAFACYGHSSIFHKYSLTPGMSAPSSGVLDRPVTKLKALQMYQCHTAPCLKEMFLPRNENHTVSVAQTSISAWECALPFSRTKQLEAGRGIWNTVLSCITQTWPYLHYAVRTEMLFFLV